MTERGIIFQDWGVRAILRDAKTQTRRIIKVGKVKEAQLDAEGWCNLPRCPYGDPGDLLYVKEAWCESPDWQPVRFRADGGESPGPKGFWRSPLFLHKKDARLWLKILDVRPERVQDITEEDARAEGVEPVLTAVPVSGKRWTDYRFGFRLVWDSINAKRGHGWDHNDWAWRIAFERTDHESAK